VQQSFIGAKFLKLLDLVLELKKDAHFH